jgi:hypothetical protein
MIFFYKKKIKKSLLYILLGDLDDFRGDRDRLGDLDFRTCLEGDRDLDRPRLA